MNLLDKIQEKQRKYNPNQVELTKACGKFGGEIIEGVCMVDGFPMAESKHVFEFHPESQTYEKWSPDKFLRLTGWRGTQWPWAGHRPGFSRESLERMKDKIRNKESVEVPWINKDADRGFRPKITEKVTWVPDHEGRHRALACEQVESCEKIPVVVYHTREGYYVPAPEGVEAAYREGYKDAKAYLEAGEEIERQAPQPGDEIGNAYRRGWNAAIEEFRKV